MVIRAISSIPSLSNCAVFVVMPIARSLARLALVASLTKAFQIFLLILYFSGLSKLKNAAKARIVMIIGNKSLRNGDGFVVFFSG